MALLESEKRIWNQVKTWENSLSSYAATDFIITYEKWVESGFRRLDRNVQTRILETFDSSIFHLNSLLQGTQMQEDARKRIISEAQLFDQNINELGDLRELPIHQLKYMANAQISKHRLASFIQGGLTGTGGLLLVSLDFPAILTINLRAIQLIGMSYGYDLRYPFETMLTMKIFQMATLPKRLQGQFWDECKKELNDFHGDYYLFDGDERFLTQSWLSQPTNQLIKSLAISMFKKKLIQGIPLVGIAVGATVNYQLTRRVTEFAHHVYQYRYLSEKIEGKVGGQK